VKTLQLLNRELLHHSVALVTQQNGQYYSGERGTGSVAPSLENIVHTRFDDSRMTFTKIFPVLLAVSLLT